MNAKSIRISMDKYLIECLLLAYFAHKIYFSWLCLSEQHPWHVNIRF